MNQCKRTLIYHRSDLDNYVPSLACPVCVLPVIAIWGKRTRAHGIRHNWMEGLRNNLRMVLLKLKNFDSLDIGISIVPYSNAIKLNCALFQRHQIELCLIPMAQNEFCLVPMSSNWIVPYSNAINWIVPNSNPIKLNCALFQPHIIGNNH